MPQNSQYAHRNLRNLNLPYVTNVSPIDTDAKFVSGSKDLLTSINGYCERRPGFATAVEGTPTVFNNLQRLFTWDRTDGTFWIMACDLTLGGVTQVFYMQAGGTSFTSLYTDTTSLVFDFVVSNNTVYFANGNVAKKWDPINGLSNWGIAVGSVSSSVNAYVGTGADGGGGHAWSSPTNFQGAPDTVYTTNAITAGAGSTVTTNALNGTNYGFSVTATNTVTGIQVDLTGLVSATGFENVTVYLQSGGTTIGTFKIAPLTNSASTVTLGGPADLWGLSSITPAQVNASTFGVQVFGKITNGTGGSISRTFSMDAAKVTVYQLGGPAVSVSGSAGTFTATAGYQYVFCYGNSNTGHVSSPSPVSANTGVFTNKLNVSITLTASTDAQVNQIRLFRTTDGGGGTYFELPTSPYPNSSGGVTDAAADTTLNVSSIAPTATFNDPPTPFQGMVYFSGRIWGFTANKVWFSGLEEINQGVPEESFPSGLSGNFWAFDEPVTGLAVAGGINNQVLAIFCGGRVYGITGNTLDTFRRFNISQRRGCRNKTTISMLGGMVAWLDSSNQIWASDGNSLQEMSQDIRPSLVGISPLICSSTFHIAGRFHWFVLSVAGADGPNAAAASADRSTSGTVAWTGIGNIFAADNVYASVSLTSQTSHILQGTPNPFITQFPLPITGIQVDVKGFQTNVTANQTFTAQLTKGLLTPVGSVKTSQLPASNGFITFGGPTDLWGTTWSSTDVGGGSGFSVNLQAIEAGGVATTFNVDYVQITVYFDGGGNRTFVYDMDTNQWMPPWSFACNYIASGETSPGNYVLMAATTTKALQLSATAFNDNSATYQPIGALGLMSVVPDYGKRFSYGAQGVYDEPSRTGVPWVFQVTNNGKTITDFQYLADDDPVLGTYTSIVANLTTPATAYNRNQGTFVKQNIYTTTSPASRWIAPKFILANADQVDNVYEMFLAYKGEGGR